MADISKIVLPNGDEYNLKDSGAARGTIPSASTATPLEDGTASVGSSADYARGDHRHPHDTSKQDDLALSIVNGQICVTYTTA